MNKKNAHLVWNLTICARLMERDLFVFKTMLVRRLINSMIWTALIVYVYEYVGIGGYAGAGLFIACSESVGWPAMGIFPCVTHSCRPARRSFSLLLFDSAIAAMDGFCSFGSFYQS